MRKLFPIVSKVTLLSSPNPENSMLGSLFIPSCYNLHINCGTKQGDQMNRMGLFSLTWRKCQQYWWHQRGLLSKTVDFSAPCLKPCLHAEDVSGREVHWPALEAAPMEAHFQKKRERRSVKVKKWKLMITADIDCHIVCSLTDTGDTDIMTTFKKTKHPPRALYFPVMFIAAEQMLIQLC